METMFALGYQAFWKGRARQQDLTQDQAEAWLKGWQAAVHDCIKHEFRPAA